MDPIMETALAQYIRDNLTVVVDVEESYGSYNSSGFRTTVQLMLNGEKISEDSCSFAISKD